MTPDSRQGPTQLSFLGNCSKGQSPEELSACATKSSSHRYYVHVHLQQTTTDISLSKLTRLDMTATKKVRHSPFQYTIKTHMVGNDPFSPYIAPHHLCDFNDGVGRGRGRETDC